VYNYKTNLNIQLHIVRSLEYVEPNLRMLTPTCNIAHNIRYSQRYQFVVAVSLQDTKLRSLIHNSFRNNNFSLVTDVLTLQICVGFRLCNTVFYNHDFVLNDTEG